MPTDPDQLEEIIKTYNLEYVANAFERGNALGFAPFLDSVAERYADNYLSSFNSIDLGTGSGWLPLMLAKYAGTHIGVDITPAMREVFNRLSGQAKNPGNVGWITADTADESFIARHEGEFSLVTAIAAHDGVELFEEHLRRTVRLLDPSKPGILIDVVYPGSEPVNSPMSEAGLLREALDSTAKRTKFPTGVWMNYRQLIAQIPSLILRKQDRDFMQMTKPGSPLYELEQKVDRPTKEQILEFHAKVNGLTPNNENRTTVAVFNLGNLEVVLSYIELLPNEILRLRRLLGLDEE